jgi:tetratricopeptide (TPR) repeat protein
MKKYFIILVGLLQVAAAQEKVPLDLTLVNRDALGDMIRNKIKEETAESYRTAVVYLNELDRRGGGKKDWEEYRISQALAQCHYLIGNVDSAYQYWEKLLGLDTAKYFGTKSSHILARADAELNRVIACEKLAYSRQGSSFAKIYPDLVDAFCLKYPESRDVPILLFNKGLFEYKSGNGKDAKATIAGVRRSYPAFQFTQRVDSLWVLLTRK